MLERYLSARAQLCVDEARGAEPVAGALELSQRFAFLASDEARELASELRPSVAVEAQEARAMLAHLAVFRQLEARARRRRILSQVFSESFVVRGQPMDWAELPPRWSRGQSPPGLDAGLADAVTPRLRELSELQRVSLGGAPAEVATEARAWLSATDDLHQAARAHLAPEASECGALLAAFAEASPWRPRGRMRRAAERLLPLGLSSLLRRVQLLPPRRDALLAVRVLSVRPPHDLRMAPPPADLGMLSELAAAQAVGQAVAQLLVAPALPAALRWDSEHSVAQAFGGLSAQVLLSPESLSGCLGAREREPQRRRLGALLVMGVRLAAGYAIWASMERSLERAGECLSRALGLSVEPALALLLAPCPGDAAALFRGARDALGLWVALRERLDEDWYRNPRAAEALRAAGARGAGLSSGAWLDELGGGEQDALRRAHELFPG